MPNGGRLSVAIHETDVGSRITVSDTESAQARLGEFLNLSSGGMAPDSGSIVHRIVTERGGSIDVQAKGKIFMVTIELPKLSKSA